MGVWGKGPFDGDGAWERVTAPTGSEWHDLWADVGALPEVPALHEPYRARPAEARAQLG